MVVGSGHIVDGKRNVIYAEGGTVAAFGVDDLVVVQCGDITLVSTTERAPDLKRLLEQLPSLGVPANDPRGKCLMALILFDDERARAWTPFTVHAAGRGVAARVSNAP